MSTHPPVFVPPPVAEIERRLRWRVLPAVLFLAVLAGLTTLGVAALFMRPSHPAGLPDDPEARRVSAVLAGRVAVPTNALRFTAAVLGGEPRNHAADAHMLALAAAARPALEGVQRRHRGDPRALAALAALDLARHDYASALRRYRRSCELAPHYAEGRLGAGVALALEADRTPEPLQSRALRLQAIAEFTMVDTTDAVYPLALHDRVLVLTDVGNTREAGFWSARARALGDTALMPR